MWRSVRTLTPALLLALVACQTVMESNRERDHRDILAAIRARGEAGVLIALYEPDGFDDPAQATQVRREIARMQDEVLAALDTNDFRPGQRFASVPAIAGTVRSERGLRALSAHPLIRRVSLDTGGTGSGPRGE
jgi:hypothetical protein